jgi:hypothetical protein
MFLLCMSEIKSEDVKSNAYDDFLIYYKRDHSLQVNDLNDLTGKLLYKFGCLSKNCDKVHLYFIFNISFGNSFFGFKCLDSSKFQIAGIIGTTVGRNEFGNVSVIIMCYLAYLQYFCNGKKELVFYNHSIIIFRTPKYK